MIRFALFAILAALMTGCAAPAPATEPLEQQFGPFAVDAAAERSDLCVSWTLDNQETLFVNTVRLEAGLGFHHSNWFYVPDNVYEGPDGVWPCDERGFNEAVAAVVGGVLFAQSTQTRTEVQAFPSGVAVPIPPGSKVVGGVHILNATPEPLETALSIRLDPIAAEDAEVLLSGLSLQYEPLAIPPHRRSVFSSDCALADEHQRQLDRPLDFSIYYVLPHYHSMGAGMRVEAIAEGRDPALVFQTESAIGEPLGLLLDEPFDMRGATGLRFSCSFESARDEVVGWGVGDQEMCVFLAFTDSELLWGGGVLGQDGSPGEPREVDGEMRFERDCRVFSVASSHF